MGLPQTRNGFPASTFTMAWGSRLFEEICELDEYYPTRTELALLRQHAKEIAAFIGPNVNVIEFGKRLFPQDPYSAGLPSVPGGLCAGRYFQGPSDPRGTKPVCGLRRTFRHPDPCGLHAKPSNSRAPSSKAPGIVLDANASVSFRARTSAISPPADALVLLLGLKQAMGEGSGFLIGVDLKEGRAHPDRRLQRRERGDGGLQSKPAGPHQSRA